MKEALTLMTFLALIVGATQCRVRCRDVEGSRMGTEKVADSTRSQTSIDSIVILYDVLGMFADCCKLTLTTETGTIQWVPRNREKPFDPRGPERLCEWQRKQLFDGIVGVFVTKEIGVVSRKEHVDYMISSSPPKMDVYIYREGKSQHEHLTLYRVWNYKKYTYTQEFDNISHLISEIAVAYWRGEPIDFGGRVPQSGN